MYLKQLTISGFKSFAKKTTLEFTRGITAIVGPNGSGKSNAADAIRWVMGEQSLKTLRGKRAEDVIFSGSDKKTRLGLAEVSLDLDNSDKQVPLAYSELKITRRVYRSGESDYLINNAKSKLSDINLLLTKANFGHRTYSVIGQGMIDNFLLASPQERKEFFEEATGVKQYQIKKNQALNKLEAVWQNLNTLKIKTDEMEPQLRLLTRQVKKLRERQEIETELSSLKTNYYSSLWREIDALYQAEKTKIDELSLNRDVFLADWQTLEKELATAVKDNHFNEELNNLRAAEQELIAEKLDLKEKYLTQKINLEKSLTTAITKEIPPRLLLGLHKKIEEITVCHQKLIDELDRESNVDLIKQRLFAINKKIELILKEIKPYLGKLSAKEPPLASPEKNKDENILAAALSLNNQKMSALAEKIKVLTETDAHGRSLLWQTQKDYQTAQTKLNALNADLNNSRVNLARSETRRFDIEREIKNELGGLANLAPTNAKPLNDGEKTIAFNKINKLKNLLEIIGGLDPEIEAEYETAKERYDFLSRQNEDLSKTSASLKKLIDDLDDIIKKQVHKSYEEINGYFKKYFKLLFHGGRADLILIREKDVFKEEETTEEIIKPLSNVENFFQEKNKNSGFSGIEVEASPPGKKLKSINSLSGGERALTSIALICAIISANPAPFVVLDEVDAALDESNSIRFAEILKNLSHTSQFIVITHNRATMEQANLLYGVTIGDDGVSKLLSIRLEEADKYQNNKQLTNKQ